MGGAVTLHAGDNRLSLRRLIEQGVRVHSVVSDPPYALTSITKRFGKAGAAAARTRGNDGSFARLSGGFMQKTWDATGIERDPEFWRLVYDILLPGGYVFAFSGARTGHWQACAMETAGFIMHPMHGWVYGQGWPKPTYIQGLPEWEGWGYGTQSQKPALEPIYLGQKPFSEKTGPANVLKHGVGAFNIKGCTVDDGENGRRPANLILDGSSEVIDLFPYTRSGAPGVMRKGTNDGATYGAESRAPGTPMTGYGDEGSAARFFHQFPLTEADYQWAIDAGLIGTDLGDAIIYNAKASKKDRLGSKHPTVKPVALLQYLIRHITPPGGVVLDMFAGSGTTAEAARREGFDCILMEAEPEYLDFLCSRFVLNPEYAIGIDAYSTVNGARINSTVSKLDITNVANKELCLLDILGDLAAVEKREVQVPGTFRSYSGYDLTELLS
ncbi:MAG: site-specific DNA-methyltransferase [Mesorhizobium sp.]|nr:MAG: site-specific DNA-methyltransferase [Mesorhizobium sp.]